MGVMGPTLLLSVFTEFPEHSKHSKGCSFLLQKVALLLVTVIVSRPIESQILHTLQLLS